MAITTTSNVSGGASLTYYDRVFLETLYADLRVTPLGQVRAIPEASGRVIQFFRYNDIPVTLTSGVVDVNLTDQTSDPSATTITGQDLQATLLEYGGYSKHSKFLKKTHIDRGFEGVSALWGHHGAEVLDLLCNQQIMSNGAMPVRADLDSAKQFSGIVDSSTATTLVDAALNSNTAYGDANDDLNQSVVVITGGTGKGQARVVTDFVTSGGTMTVSPAWDVNPAAGDTYMVVSPDALSSATGSNADSLNTNAIRRGMRLLKEYSAPTFKGGYFMGVLSPETEEGLMKDTNWVNVMQYKDQVGSDGLFTGEVGKWGGVRWVSTNRPFKFATETIGTSGTGGGPGANGINYSASSYAEGLGVTASLIMGKDAFGRTSFKDSAGKIQPAIIMKNPGPTSTDNPLNRFSTVGWQIFFVAKALQPLWAVQVWSSEPQL